MTVAPNTSGAWTLANGSDQTPAANTAQRLLYNTWVRNNVLGVDGFFDTVGPSKLTADENRWNADGTAAKYTGDGLHETAFANQQYVFTGP